MEDADMFDHAASGAAAAAADAIGELAAKDEKYGSLPSWNIVVICTVGGILFFELICHQMNHAAAGKRHAQELLETLYRELAILGVVAFILWSINVSPVVDIEYGDKHFFEQIHMALFLAALLHTFFVGVVALYSRQINRRWDIFEDDEMRRYKDLKQQHRRTAQRLGIRHSSLKQGIGLWRSAWLTIRHPILYPRLAELSEHVGYHAIRAQFIKANHLPKNFRFASYLIKCEQSVVLNLAGIKEGVWVALILLAGAELFVKGILGEAESSKDVKPIFITGTCLVMLTAIAVHFKLKDIYHTMIRSYSASTDRRDDFMQFLSPDAAGTMRQKDLFWFSSPGLMIVGLQSMQFLLAIMVGAVIWFGRTDSTGLMILAEVILAVGAFGIYTVVLPKFIPKFTTVTHVGHMVNRHILSDCLVKQKRAFQHRSLPPTLRQVSEMARVKADDQAVNRTGVMYYIKKVVGGHAWREFIQVLITVHFFVVAYNTDPIEDGVDTRESFVAELSLGTAALFFELMGHLLIWGGRSFFRFSCFATVEEDSIVAKEAVRPAASIHPSARQLLHNSEGSSSDKIADVKKGGTMAVTEAPSGHGLQKPGSVNKATATTGHYQDDDYYHDEHQVRRCSVWACFGWNGEDRGKRIMSVPPSAQVGWWRTVDFLLVAAVAGCSIATFMSNGGTTRVVVHALQGLVILRWLPLMFCPFPPAAGHNDLHDVGGATVHHDPLDHHAREEVMRETLNLLRAQNKLSTTFDNNMHDVNLGATYAETLNAKMLKKGPVEEEKAADASSAAAAAAALPTADGIANVGVAVALREACAAHPDLVQSQGPLSAPILRAMLGIDPYKSVRQDDVQALRVAAGAFSLARGVSGADAQAAAVEAEVAGAVRAATPGRGHLRKEGSWYGDRPPSPSRSSNNSSSSSELSSSEEEGRRYGRKASNLSASQHHRGRLSSWVGQASRHRGTSGASQSYRLQLQQQQQILFQQQQQQQQMQYQQQQMHLHYQLQQQQRRSAGSVQDDVMSNMEGGTGFDNHGGGPGSVLSLDTGMAAQAPPPFSGLNLPYMGAPFPGVGGYGLAPQPPAFEATSISSRHLPAAGIQPRRSASVSGVSTKSSRHHRGRSGGGSRSRRRSRSTSAGGGGDSSIVPPALEDMERPVLRNDSQHGPRSTATTPRSASGVGSGFHIPTGSGRSIIPFSSSHRATRVGPRGTPGRRGSVQSADSAAESEVVGQAATEAAEATVAGRRDLDSHVASDATQAASSVSGGGGDGSFTPSGSAAAAAAAAAAPGLDRRASRGSNAE